MTVAAIAAAVTATLGAAGVSLRLAVTDHQALVGTALTIGVLVAFTVVGAVITGARPRNAVGWLILAGGTLWCLGGAAVDLAHHGIVVAPDSTPGAAVYAVAGSATRSVGWYVVTLGVPMLFPDGRVLGGRWRWLPWLLVVVLVGAVLDPLTDAQADLTNLGPWRNPIGSGGAQRVLSPVAFLAHIPLGLALTVAIMAQLRARWRRGGAFERQQLRMFLVAAALPIIAVPVVFGVGYGTGTWVFGLAALPLPFAIGFAVLARGLYDLRTAANRTLVWFTLSAVVAGLYALVIAGIGGRFNVPGTSWLPWVAAAVVAVSFAPLRDVLQRAVNRLTFGRWDEPYEVLAALGQRLEATADVDRLLAEVTTELAALGLQEVSVCDRDGHVVAGQLAAPADEQLIALSAYAQPVGMLRFRSPAVTLRARDRRLLEDLAGHLGGVLHAHQLSRDLQRALERLVLSREEERRRLRRDLHDGLGPALAGHLLRLDVIAGKLDSRSPVRGDVDDLREQLRCTVIEVRRVVEGLRPPALDELGLAAALEQATQLLVTASSMRLEIELAQLPPLPAAIEVATFRIVTEAVNNAVRHSGATCCRVAVTAADAVLRIAVEDDGHGFTASPQRRGGHGLQTMRERAEELRGRFRVEQDNGTAVVAEIPLPTGGAVATRRSMQSSRPA